MKTMLRLSRQFVMAGLLATAALVAGCRSPHPAPTPTVKAETVKASSYPARPDVAPPAFKLFHHDDSSVTLVTDEHASDPQIEAILWELHDAAQTHSFDKLGIPQTLVDKRSPIIWFHVYRGSKCADEKYTNGKLPCGASYHAAGDYTLGSFHNPNRDDGVLLQDENHETHLWNPDAPAKA